MSKILVIEDEEGIREVLNDILTLSGYEVKTAVNGREGYEVILAEQPDLVLCDVNMPDLNGFDMLTALRQKMEGKIIPPFIFLTAKVEPEDIKRGLKLGADDYITKPFDHKDVLEIIKFRLEKRIQLLGTNQTKTENDQVLSLTKIAIPNEDGLELVQFSDIEFCKADRAYCTFYLSENRKILVSKPMKDFEERLIERGFFKVHKSMIVNLDHVLKYVNGSGGHLIMSSGEIVPVSVRRKKNLLDALKQNA
jgi:two-component system, LytTR family, response regulator